MGILDIGYRITSPGIHPSQTPHPFPSPPLVLPYACPDRPPTNTIDLTEANSQKTKHKKRVFVFGSVRIALKVKTSTRLIWSSDTLAWEL